MRARSSQIFAGLIPYNNNDDDVDGPPPKYWNTLLQSYHERIDASYYISLGRGDVYADAMMQLQRSLEMTTRKLVTTKAHFMGVTCVVRLFPIIDDEESDEELPIFLQYDPKILSRWKALFHAMAGNNFWSVFEVKNIEIPKVVMDEFIAALEVRATYFSDEYSLKFDNNNLDNGCLECIMDKRVAHSMIELVVINNTMGQLPTIPNHLRKIDLSGSGFSGPIYIATLLSACTNLNELLLNNMPSGVAITEDCLGSNPPLRLLELKLNHLDDNDAEVLASSLKTNTHLHTLSLEGNSFSKVAEGAFIKAICNDDDLNAVIDSNHTCSVCGVSEEVEKLQCTVEEKKFRSIRHGTSFNDVPLELMPDVLAWLMSVPSNNTVLPKASSLMFETLRSWNLPSLFVGRHQPEEIKMCLRDMISTVSNEDVVLGQSFHQALLPPRKSGEYDTVIPKYEGDIGLQLNVAEFGYSSIGTGVSVYGYRRREVGLKGPAELFRLIKLGDVITAVNGISTIDKSFKETVTLLKKANLPFVYMRLESRVSFFRPLLNIAQSKYDSCFERSLNLQREKKIVEEEYTELVQLQKKKHLQSTSERLQRLQARMRVGKKNSIDKLEEKMLASERNRGLARNQIRMLESCMKGLPEFSYQDCPCGRATRCCCLESCCSRRQLKKQRTSQSED